uniref:50S ribosomal protein L35 n=1 Tax=Ascaris lumbricoides TaxID=6252 RepID=A0A0M3HK06_ASCLU
LPSVSSQRSRGKGCNIHHSEAHSSTLLARSSTLPALSASRTRPMIMKSDRSITTDQAKATALKHAGRSRRTKKKSRKGTSIHSSKTGTTIAELNNNPHIA